MSFIFVLPTPNPALPAGWRDALRPERTMRTRRTPVEVNRQPLFDGREAVD